MGILQCLWDLGIFLYVVSFGGDALFSLVMPEYPANKDEEYIFDADEAFPQVVLDRGDPALFDTLEIDLEAFFSCSCAA